MRLTVLAAVLVLADTCPLTGPNAALPKGTWGGENAGVIVDDTTMHVHIGCTLGDAPRPELLDGRFEVLGVYTIDAYPVHLGIFHPARFTGEVHNDVMTLTVTLTDTSVTLGPVSVQHGTDAKMGPCPICRSPAADR